MRRVQLVYLTLLDLAGRVPGKEAGQPPASLLQAYFKGLDAAVRVTL